MESIIGNISNVTQHNYEDCDVDPYRNLFELNEEEINMNEYDDNDNQIIQPELDGLDHDVPHLETNDNLKGAKLDMPHPYGKMIQATIKARRCTHDGNLVRTANDNPVLNSRVYGVKFEDGNYREYSESSHSDFFQKPVQKKLYMTMFLE